MVDRATARTSPIEHRRAPAARRARWKSAAATVALGALALVPRAVPQESLRYELTPHFGEGRLHVELVWQTSGRKQSALRVSERVGPIDNVPAMLQNLRLSHPYRRQDARWLIQHRAGESLRCNYDVVSGRQAFDRWETAHCPITTNDFFHGLGNAFLLVPNSGPGVPEEFEVVIRWKLPAGYQAVCSWGAGRHIGARMKASDLRHSVYLAGRLATTTRNDEGRKVTVAMVDDFGFTLDEFAAMTNAIIAGQCAFMLEEHFPEFVVTAIPVGEPLKAGDARVAGSGLYNSFALFVAPEAKLDDAVEHLFAHELFHHWNGRLLAAQQPERLVYWFTEGFTDYYALRILHESGHWSAAKYAEWINRHVREYYLNPAINASNETIEKDYWNERATVGEVAYQRGLLLGLRWHKLARAQGVSDGIDRLFKALVNRARGSGREVSNSLVREAGRELLGDWFAGEFDRFVTRAETIDLPTDALLPTLRGEPREVYSFELGFDRERSLKDRKVRGLVPGSAAERAGLRAGDRLLGWNLNNDPDQPTRLRVERAGKEQTITYYPRGAKRVVPQFSATE